MSRNLGVSMRMFISVAVVVVMYAVTFLVVGLSLAELTRDTQQGDEKTLPYILLADDLILNRSEITLYLNNVAASLGHGQYNQAEQSARRFREDIAQYKRLLQEDDAAEQLRQIEAIDAGFNRYYASGKIMAEAMLGGGQDAALSAAFNKHSTAIENQLATFREQLVAAAHSHNAGVVRKVGSAINMMIAGGLLASLSAAFFALWIVRSILKKMGGEPDYAAEVVQRVADGDLSITVRVKAGDNNSLLHAVKDMIRKLSGIVANIRDSTESITTASQEIASGNTDLSQRTEQQATSLDETAVSLKELLSTVRQNAESARHAYQLVQGCCDIAEQSGVEVDKLVATMTTINDSSGKIENIISVIDGIAFQTNILALNAAVEAARAGEQGRGFAVVAGEVRNLAQRSAAAAREIKVLIGGSRQDVDDGSTQVKDAASSISDVVTSVHLVASLMKDISATTTAQSTSIEQVNSAIIQMDEFTQQNAALVEQAAAAAESLQAQAQELMLEVSAFKLETGRARIQDAAGPAAQAVATRRAPQFARQASAVPPRKLAKAKPDKDGDWQEF